MSHKDCPNKNDHLAKNLKIDEPAYYSIRVIGFLDKTWSDRLGGLNIETSVVEGLWTMTTLTGQLADQAALFGVLNALYDMRLPLLSLECLEVN